MWAQKTFPYENCHTAMMMQWHGRWTSRKKKLFSMHKEISCTSPTSNDAFKNQPQYSLKVKICWFLTFESSFFFFFLKKTTKVANFNRPLEPRNNSYRWKLITELGENSAFLARLKLDTRVSGGRWVTVFPSNFRTRWLRPQEASLWWPAAEWTSSPMVLNFISTGVLAW